MTLRTARLAVALAAIPFSWAFAQAAAQPAEGQALSTRSLVSAERIFERFRADCKADGGALWGVSLCGPLLLVAEDGRVTANMADPEGRLKRVGAVWTAEIPKGSGPIFSDTSADWSGRQWAIVRHQPERTALDYARLTVHESFHRIQPQLKFSVSGTTTADHLDEPAGRLWLRLTLRALRAAIEAPNRRAAREHLTAALAMNAYRHHFPNAAEAERQLELHEGLAEYTAWRLARSASVRAELAEHLGTGDSIPSYSRSFAYYSGPAWGLAFDRFGVDWRRRLADGAPGLPAAGLQALRLDMDSVTETRATALAQRYGHAALFAQERERGERTAAARAEFRARFVEGPRLIVPLHQVNFNPGTVTALPDHGQVYGTLAVTGPWGSLTTTHGALVNWARREVVVDALGEPRLPSWSTARWQLELNPAWKLERRGKDLVVVPLSP